MGVEKYLRDNIDFEDKNLSHWLLMRFSSFFKEEIRLERAEIELIESYRLALDKIYDAIKSDQLLCIPRVEEVHPIVRPYAMVFKTYSLGIPFIFLARHLIELSLKNFLENDEGPIMTGHKISELWIACKRKDPSLSIFDDLIECICIMDDDELHFRYAKGKNGKEYDNKPLFIEYAKIYQQTKSLSTNLVPATTLKKLQSK